MGIYFHELCFLSYAHRGGAFGVTATLGRQQIHRMLGVLAAKAREAEWDLGELAWFDRAAQVVVPAGTLLS